MNQASFRKVLTTYVLGAFMVLAAVLGLDMLINELECTSDYLTAVSKVILLAFGLLIIFDPHKNNMKTVGIYAIAIGLGRIFVALSLIFLDSEMLGDYPHYIGYLLLILGLMMLYNGINYVLGLSVRLRGMTMNTGLVMILYCGIIAFMFYYGMTFSDIWENFKGYIGLVIMYVAYLMVLRSKEVISNTPLEKINTALSLVSTRTSPSGSLMISREDVTSLVNGFEDRSSWKKMDEFCPVESEMQYPLGGERAAALVQKWKDKDGLFITLIIDPERSIIAEEHINVLSISPENGTIDDCNAVLFRDGCGVCLRLEVGDAA